MEPPTPQGMNYLRTAKLVTRAWPTSRRPCRKRASRDNGVAAFVWADLHGIGALTSPDRKGRHPDDTLCPVKQQPP